MVFPEVVKAWLGTFMADKEDLVKLSKKQHQMPGKKRTITPLYESEWIGFMQRYSNVMAVLCQNRTMVRVHFATYM